MTEPTVSATPASIDYKAIARLFVDAEIRECGRCRTTTMIQLNCWVSNATFKPKVKFFSDAVLRNLHYPALFIECYRAMRMDVEAKASTQPE